MNFIERSYLEQDIKKALRGIEKTMRTAIAEVDDDLGDKEKERAVKRKMRSAARRNFEKVADKQRLRNLMTVKRDAVPAFGVPLNPIQQQPPVAVVHLDEVVVYGKRPTAGTNRTNGFFGGMDLWDGSLKDPWPNTKWQWFEDRVSGSPVWGTGGGSMELGNARGKNSMVGSPYDMGEWALPGGKGGRMRFWADLDNWTKYGLKGVQTVTGGVEHGTKLRNEYNKQFLEVSRDTIMNYTRYRIIDTYKDDKNNIKSVYWDSISRDTSLNKKDLPRFKRFVKKLHTEHQKSINEILDVKNEMD